MTLVLGVDGGNSKAVALVARSDGAIIGAAREVGSADIHASAGPEAAIARVVRTSEAAIGGSGASRDDIGTGVFSLAGADWPEDIELLSRSLEAVGLARRVQVINDGIGAMAGAVPDGPAVVVSIGTGAATGARGADGATWHSSFWQAPQGATELAQRALAAVVQSELGIRAPTVLRDAMLAIGGDDGVEALLHRFTARGAGPPPVGRMVRTLLDGAQGGDAVAVDVLRVHGTGLGALAAAAARQVGIEATAYALAFCGGLARAGAGELRDAAHQAVRGAGQAPVAVEPRWEPAIGALVIGLRAGASAPLPEDVASRLDATAPGPALFDTLFV